MFLQTEPGEERGCCPFAEPRRAAGCHQRQRRVLCRGEGRQQVELLEDEAQVRQPEVSQPPAAGTADIEAEDFHAAGIGREDGANDADERGLAAAGGPDEKRHFPSTSRKVGAAKHSHGRFAGGERLLHADTADGDRSRWRVRRQVIHELPPEDRCRIDEKHPPQAHGRRQEHDHAGEHRHPDGHLGQQSKATQRIGLACCCEESRRGG